MIDQSSDLPICFDDVRKASARLQPVAVRTPLITSPWLDGVLGGRALLKAENLQRTGSFKFRGAYNRLVQIAPSDRAKGVVAWSSGNHAQGVAAAAQLLDIPATIVMPHDAPTIKRANTEAYGAVIRPYDRAGENREAIGRALAADQGATLVPSYDDADIMAGQGTAGLEIAEQAKAQGVELDQLVICCGGGGLTAGCATALAHLSPKTKIYTAEPEGFDDHARSFLSRRRESVMPGATSFCDALLSPTPGELTFKVNQLRVAGGLVVNDQEVAAAMRFAFERLKLVLEPGGAVALAAVLCGKIETTQRTTAIMLSGGNVDAALFASVLKQQAP